MTEGNSDGTTWNLGKSEKYLVQFMQIEMPSAYASANRSISKLYNVWKIRCISLRVRKCIQGEAELADITTHENGQRFDSRGFLRVLQLMLRTYPQCDATTEGGVTRHTVLQRSKSVVHSELHNFRLHTCISHDTIQPASIQRQLRTAVKWSLFGLLTQILSCSCFCAAVIYTKVNVNNLAPQSARFRRIRTKVIIKHV